MTGEPISSCPDLAHAAAHRAGVLQHLRIIAPVAAIWVASDLGYYLVLPRLTSPVAYNAAPVTIALYYLFWVGVTVAAFRPVYRQWRPFRGRWCGLLPFFASIAALFVFAFTVLPSLPSIKVDADWDPPELLFATSWYFLPKAVDILFQQLLVVVLVLSFAAERCRMVTMSLCCAGLFGGTHLLLAFGGVPAGYVIRFTLVAAAFGLAFPYLILRVPNGFAWSYLTHWSYYAISVALAHTISPYAA